MGWRKGGDMRGKPERKRGRRDNRKGREKKEGRDRKKEREKKEDAIYSRGGQTGRRLWRA